MSRNKTRNKVRRQVFERKDWDKDFAGILLDQDVFANALFA